MTPITAPPLPTTAPASDLAVAPAGHGTLSAFDPSLAAATQARQADPSALGSHIMRSLNGYRADLQQMQGVTTALTGSATAGAPAGAAPPPGLAGAPPALGSAPDGRPMVGLMVQTFNFAIETELVTRAATQFTGSVSTLMKGQ